MTILCYHAVDDSWDSKLVVSPGDFARQCAWLARHRVVVPLDKAATAFEARGRLPKGWTALTFDDGFEGLFEHALPVLERHGLPATIFLVAETLTESGRSVDWVDDGPATPPTTLDRDQILEMRRRGVDFGSHTFSHHDLTTLDESDCVDDLSRSRALLEDLIGEPVPHLAYPRGRHNDAVRRASERAGYTYAFSLPETRETTGAHAIPRAGVYRGNPVSSVKVKSSARYMSLRMNGVYPLLRGVARKALSTVNARRGNA